MNIHMQFARENAHSLFGMVERKTGIVNPRSDGRMNVCDVRVDLYGNPAIFFFIKVQ